MTSEKSISAGLKSADLKMETLRKAFDELESHSSALASFILQWKDVEEYFDSVRKSTEERLKELESKEKQIPKGSSDKKSPETKKSPSEIEKTPVKVPLKKLKVADATPTSELKSLCVNMDGKGLRSYIMLHRDDLATVRSEVTVALQSAPDPAQLVLDALGGFKPSNSRGDKHGEFSSLRRVCILLLEQLATLSRQIKPEVKEKAKNLAIKWKEKLSRGSEHLLEVLDLLLLIGTYELASAFGTDEVLNLVCKIVRRKQAVDLFRLLNIPDKAPDLIEKLNSTRKQLDAVKFVYAFELVDKYPPVPLLKQYVKELKKVAHDTLLKGRDSVQSQNEANAKEISGLKGIIKMIEDHNLESEYPRESLVKRVEYLEKQKPVRKRVAVAPAKPPQQQETGDKRPRVNPVATSLPPLAQTSFHQPGLLSDRVNPYLSSSAGLYGLGGPTPTPVASYMSSSIAPYGLSGNLMGYGGQLSPTRSQLYSSESLTSGLYDRPASYGGQGLLSQYRPPYYP